LLNTPALYLATGAIVAGDALGNLHLFVPLGVAIGFAVAAMGAFLLGRAASGILLAVLGIIAAATVPAYRLLAPDVSSETLRHFPDGASITLKGWVVRAPEYEQGGRTYLYLSTERAELPPSASLPATGLVRVTAIGKAAVRIGDEIVVSGKIRFPINDGDEGEFDYASWLMRQGIGATVFLANSKHDRATGVPLCQGCPSASARGALQPITIIRHRDVIPLSQVQAIRDRIAQFMDATLRYPQNAEMRALIIGDRGGIDQNLRQSFALTGMAHLLVISGLHLGFVAAAAFFVTRLAIAFLPGLMALGYANKLGACAAAIAVSAYASIAGGHVSTIRALVMVQAYALAILIDRPRELLASLALAALVVCFAFPGSTADIGFQLSFASVLVILLGMRRFNAWWRWHYANPLSARTERPRFGPGAEWICGYLTVSFWAMLGTAPLTAFHFNQFSLVGLVANAVVVPVMGFGAVVCGLLAAATSFICRPLAAETLLVAAKLASVGTSLAQWFERWPLAWTRTFTPTPLEVAIAYGVIFLWLTAPLSGARVLRLMQERGLARDDGAGSPERSGYDAAWVHRWRAAAAAVLTAALIIDAGWWIYERYLNPDLRITFLSVGEGDAAVVRFPGAQVMLIDGGGAFRGTFDPGERIVAAYLWAHKIMRVNYVALSHPDRDHFGGLTFIFRNFAPSQFWTAGASSDDASYRELLDAVKASHARQWLCDSAAPPLLLAGVSLQCLGPLHSLAELKHNNSSMILRIAYGRESFLFTGDVEAKGERELIASGADLHATILKVPHHGSHTSSSAAFIEAVHPQLAVISLGHLNQFHFPAPEVIARYTDDGIRVLRTDEDGAVSVDASRSAARIATYREDPFRGQ
jgi:competence protein ComEC